MRLLLAARLSRVANGQTGIESQDRLAREWAERSGHQIVSVAADTKSGTSHPWNRPNLRPWVSCGCDWCAEWDKKRGLKNPAYDRGRIALYDGVVAYRLDRLSRGDDASTSAIEEWARVHDKLLLTEDGLIYPCEGTDGIRWDISKRIAHEEWLKTSERYRRMQAHLREGGYLVGDTSFGHQIACAEQCGETGRECKHHKVLVPDLDLKPYVEGIAERYLNGDSLAAICRWLDSEGVKSRHGGPWRPTALRAIMGNPALIGRRKDAKGKTVLRFEPVLDQVTWQRMQDRLAGNPLHIPLVDEPALLSGVIWCATCKGILHQKRVYTRRKDGSKKYHAYYKCDGTPIKPSTCMNMIRMADADESVSGWVTEVIGRMQLIERVVVPGSGHEDEIASVESDIRELDLDSPDYLARHQALMAERRRLKALPAEPSKVMERPTGIKVRDYWERMDKQARRRFLLAGQVKVMALSELKARSDREGREGQFSIEALMGEWTVG
jgi:hypothetical protein